MTLRAIGTRRSSWHIFILLAAATIAALAILFATRTAAAQEPAAQSPERPKPAEAGSAAALSREQEELAEKYKRFEEVLVRMAELTAPSDPKRAALLRKAVAESKQQLIGVQLDKLVELLAQDRLSVAINNQGDLNKDLAELLHLLLTEEREKGLKDKRASVKEQIRRVNELINKERQLQGQTANGGEMRGLAQGQGKVAEDAGKLAKDMQQADAEGKEKVDGESKKNGDGKQSENAEGEGEDQPAGEKSGEGKESAGKKSDGDKSGEGKSGDSDSQEVEPKDGESKDGKDDKPSSKEKSDDKKPEDDKPGDKSDGEAGKPSEGSEQSGGKQGSKSKPQEGQQQPGQQGEQGEQSQDSPSGDQQQQSSESARKRVQAAQEKMDAARQKLEKAQRQGAVEEQEAAIRELEQAKAELEEILRQLREEELERMLAVLESRFRKMLQAQLEVYEGTKRVDSKPAEDRDRDDEIEAGRLGRKESTIVIEAESALAVLREEGSAVAFPEAVEQMRDDMELIVRRLAQADVGDITQSIEEDVIAALEEMIDSLQKAQQDLEKEKQQGQPQEGESQEPPLIDTIAELKMIRSLQMRVNMRTKRLARLVEGEVGQAERPELLEQLQRLAEREESVFRVTRDIVTGKNK